MTKEILQKLMSVINEAIISLDDNEKAYNTLLDNIGDAQWVLLGEASHGTHEFYQARIYLTERLIKERGFMAVAIEADWPDVHLIYRYLHGVGEANNPKQALSGFKRFPTWMWRNTTMLPFLRRLRDHNDNISNFNQKIGLYGLDLYSLNTSIQAVIDFLQKIDPEAAIRAKTRYSCFDEMSIHPELYSQLINLRIKKSCVNEAIAELIEMQHKAFEYLHHDGLTAEDEYFFAIQNARLVKNAENYYRNFIEGHVSTWNIRDKHMAETLNVLADHLEKRFNKPAKVIVWAHNSHIGDARATEMSANGELNFGQIMREQHNTNLYSVGFSTYEGHVTAATNWGEEPEIKSIVPGLPGSFEDIFHQAKYKNFLLTLHNNEKLEHFLEMSRLQRAG